MQSQPRALHRALRRGLALAAATATGILAAGLVGTPASAHTASIGGSFVCDRKTGEYVVTWTVSNDYKDAATLSKVTVVPDGTTWTTPLPTTVPAAASKEEPSSVTGVLRVPGAATETSLSVHATWPDQYHKVAAAKIKLAGTCAPNEAKPSAEIVLTCDILKITLANEGTAPARFRIYLNIDDGEYEQVDERWVKPGETVEIPEDDEELAAKRTSLTAAEEDAPLPVLSIKVTAEHMADVEESLDLADCEETEPSESPSPTPSFSASPSPVVEVPSSAPPAAPPSGSLPVTGASVGGLAVGALAALGLGTLLTVLARRRKQS